MNELTLQELKFDAKIQTSIELENESLLNDLVTNVESKYTDLIYSADNEKEAKKDRADLNKIVKQIDDERKKVKKKYNEPLKIFEEKMKGYSNRINQVIAPIDVGIKELELAQKAERLEQVKKYILEVAPAYEIEPSEIVIDDKWLNKSISKIQRERLITDAMTLIKKQKDHKNNEINIVKSYTSALDIDEEAWLLQLEQGKTSVEIMKLIDESIIAKKEREEYERKKAEEAERQRKVLAEKTAQEKKDRAEYQKELERINEQAELSKKQTVEDLVSCEESAKEETLILKFTATEEQLNLLSDFIVANNIKAQKM